MKFRILAFISGGRPVEIMVKPGSEKVKKKKWMW